MNSEKESAPSRGSKGRASVMKDKRIVPQDEWERGCWALPAAFALMALLYAVWMAA